MAILDDGFVLSKVHSKWTLFYFHHVPIMADGSYTFETHNHWGTVVSELLSQSLFDSVLRHYASVY